MWRVAYADGHLDKYEEHLIRQVAELTYVPHQDYIRAKLAGKGLIQLRSSTLSRSLKRARFSGLSSINTRWASITFSFTAVSLPSTTGTASPHPGLPQTSSRRSNSRWKPMLLSRRLMPGSQE